MRLHQIVREAMPGEYANVSVINLLHLITTKADSQGIPAQMRMDSFIKLLSNVGGPATKEEFELLQQTVPAIGNMVSSMDDGTITLKSASDQIDDPDGDTVTDEPESGDANTVRSMAKRAADRRD